MKVYRTDVHLKVESKKNPPNQTIESEQTLCAKYITTIEYFLKSTALPYITFFGKYALNLLPNGFINC